MEGLAEGAVAERPVEVVGKEEIRSKEARARAQAQGRKELQRSERRACQIRTSRRWKHAWQTMRRLLSVSAKDVVGLGGSRKSPRWQNLLQLDAYLATSKRCSRLAICLLSRGGANGCQIG